MLISDIKPKLILRQDITGAFILSVFVNKSLRVADIALGTDEDTARQTARRIHLCMKLVDAIEG